jgi:hypothetical protein
MIIFYIIAPIHVSSYDIVASSILIDYIISIHK